MLACTVASELARVAQTPEQANTGDPVAPRPTITAPAHRRPCRSVGRVPAQITHARPLACAVPNPVHTAPTAVRGWDVGCDRPLWTVEVSGVATMGVLLDQWEVVGEPSRDLRSAVGLRSVMSLGLR
ncbi:MAG: hypothetical protein DLM61_18115 [Pseudonocardiales bacterium]|nr:MAG: hypothetical protein DLM61_18115 [Pseudonocardiales bacterium]